MDERKDEYNVTFAYFLLKSKKAILLLVLIIMVGLIIISKFKQVALHSPDFGIEIVDNVDDILLSKGELLSNVEKLLEDRARITSDPKKKHDFLELAEQARILRSENEKLQDAVSNYRKSGSNADLDGIVAAALKNSGLSDRYVKDAMDQMANTTLVYITKREVSESSYSTQIRDSIVVVERQLAQKDITIDSLKAAWGNNKDNPQVAAELKLQIDAIQSSRDSLASAYTALAAKFKRIPFVYMQGGKAELQNVPRSRNNSYKFNSISASQNSFRLVLFPEINPGMEDSAKGSYNATLEIHYPTGAKGERTRDIKTISLKPGVIFDEKIAFQKKVTKGNYYFTLLLGTTILGKYDFKVE